MENYECYGYGNYEDDDTNRSSDNSDESEDLDDCEFTGIKNLKMYNIEEPVYDICSICQETDSNINCKLRCKHFYHYTCIYNWVSFQLKQERKPSCPMCRKKISLFDSKAALEDLMERFDF